MPRARVPYHGTVLEEMDLDALLARRPQLALVDELAHSNAPGSRHRKRHQDVEELLDAGIDVLTTLNIQHVESLNDVVAGITRIRVRETVPDGILDRADDIEVVDLNPDDLIQRLKDGKVYVPEGAERALRHYFSRGNLTALRELALRRTADRVDDELLGHMRANAIAGPWAAGERVLVCVSDDPRSVSHDLRTPLASVLGAASTLRDLGPALPHAARSELLATVIEESERLNRFIANLLDMTRLEAGAVAPNLSDQDVAYIVDAAPSRCGRSEKPSA
ncbi:K+-sensing histidine kinase KdpD [Methylorubrum rhodinum]|uniref:histidine kinase n=1 Tax=Methylorubrum rhodinum TaxID=29428 RepID=A0A840ZR92_9HYPH|nr:K+-sensing histidine kinase KdpD [Methylorubrum rhodinum]